MTHTKQQNGIDKMTEPTKRQKLIEFRKREKTIDRKLKDTTSNAEAKLLLRTLIYHFDGFACQQQIINAYMSSKYHWGNKRTARVLEKLAEIGMIDRSKSRSDNWTLFFLVRGFLAWCEERIERAKLAIMERLSRYRLAILTITRTRDVATGT